MAPESLDGPQAADSTTSAAEKAGLRERMRRLRASIPPAERARLADLVEENLLWLPQVIAAETVLLFYSFGTEVATGGMASRVLAQGKRLLLPYLVEGSMETAEVLPGETLEPSDYGPREPARRVAVDPAGVDVVVTPGLAFDKSGNRLGYGGGHYDRYLERMGPGALRVGVAFSLQIIEHIPVEPGDQRVDFVISDAGSLDARPVQ